MIRLLARTFILAVVLLLIGCAGGGNPTQPNQNNPASTGNQKTDLTGTSAPTADTGGEPDRILGNFYYATEDQEILAWGTVLLTKDGWNYRLDYLAPKLRALQRSETTRAAQCAVIDLTWLRLITVGVAYTNKPAPPPLPKYEPGEFMKYRVDITNNVPYELKNQSVVATQVNMFNQPLGSDASDTWKDIDIPKTGISLNGDWTVQPTLKDGIYYTRVRVSFKAYGGWITIVIFDSKAGAFKVQKGGGNEKFDPVAKGITTTPIVAVGENVHVQDNGSYDPDGGPIVQYAWDINNDGTFDFFGASADFSYPSPGEYLVNLRVTDDEGATDDLTDDPGDELIKITVTPPPVPPIAIAHASDLTPFTGEKVTFDGTDSYDPDGGSIVLYEWDWNGDGVYDDAGAIIDHMFPAPGKYEVGLRVTDDELQTDTLDTPLEINVSDEQFPPIACANWSIESGDNPVPCQTVNFDASCSTDPNNDIKLYEWDWDNNGTYDFSSDTPLAAHSFDTTGDKFVQLRVTDSVGNTDTLDTPLKITVVNAAPTSIAKADSTDVLIGQDVNFDGTDSHDNDCDGVSIVKYEWDFESDGTIDSTDAKPVHAYGTDGLFQVTLKVTDDEGGTAINNPLLDINVSKQFADPIAVGSADPNPQTVCLAVHFSGDGSYDPDGGPITEYAWDWNNDGVYDDFGKEVDHTWTVPGTFDVQLRVTDDEGKTGTLVEPLHVEIDNALPTADASADNLNPFVSQSVHFDGSTSHDNDCNNSSIVKWEWDFNYDGSFNNDGEGATIDHSYGAEGVYQVQLRVTDDEGTTDILDTPITINVKKELLPPIPFAQALPNPQTVCLDVNFSDNGSYDPDGGPITEYAWDWNNDGTFDDFNKDTTHSWDTPGTYYVQFRVTDDDGQSSTLASPLQIVIQNALPTAGASVDFDSAITGQVLNFDGSTSHDNDCSGSIVKWEWAWDWANDQTFQGSGEFATHSYDTPGIYQVQLRVTDDENTTAMLDQPLTITVILPPCPGGIHDFNMNRGVSYGYSTLAYSILPRADVAFLQSGPFAGQGIVQGGPNSLLLFDPNADNLDPIDDNVISEQTGGSGQKLLVTNLKASPFAGLVAEVTSDKPYELKLVDPTLIIGDNVVYTSGTEFDTSSPIMAVDFNSNGDIWLLSYDQHTSVRLYHATYVGASTYFTNWQYTDITAYEGTESDIFGIAIQYNAQKLYVYDAGDGYGRLNVFDISSTPTFTDSLSKIFLTPIQYQFDSVLGVAGFAEIAIDHQSGREECRILLYARTNDESRLLKLNDLLEHVSVTTYPDAWPSMAIDPQGTVTNRSLMMPGESKLGFWNAPSNW